jgi:hypothetical protein
LHEYSTREEVKSKHLKNDLHPVNDWHVRLLVLLNPSEVSIPKMVALKDLFTDLIDSVHLELSRMRFHNQAVIDAYMEVLSDGRRTIKVSVSERSINHDLRNDDDYNLRKKTNIIVSSKHFLYILRVTSSPLQLDHISIVVPLYINS